MTSNNNDYGHSTTAATSYLPFLASKLLYAIALMSQGRGSSILLISSLPLRHIDLYELRVLSFSNQLLRSIHSKPGAKNFS